MRAWKVDSDQGVCNFVNRGWLKATGRYRSAFAMKKKAPLERCHSLQRMCEGRRGQKSKINPLRKLLQRVFRRDVGVHIMGSRGTEREGVAGRGGVQWAGSPGARSVHFRLPLKVENKFGPF